MRKIAMALAVMLGSTPALATVELSGFQINGWLDIGVAWSNVAFQPDGFDPVYIARIRKDPSWDQDSNVGIQITKFIQPEVSVTVQLYASAYDRWDVDAMWAFIKWEPNDYWRFRVGRVRTEPYMLSNYLNVGYAYPWIRPPQEVYSQIPDSNFTGIDGTFRIPIWHRDLTITGFWGGATSDISFPIKPYSTIYDVTEVRTRNATSICIRYGDEVFSVRAGYETARITLYPNSGTSFEGLNAFLNAGAGPLSPFTGISPEYLNYFTGFVNKQSSFYGIGYQFDWKNIVSMGELVKRESQINIMNNSTGWYLMGGYRFKEILPHITFARERVTGTKGHFPDSVNNFFLNGFGPVAGLGTTLNAIMVDALGISPYAAGGAGQQTSLTIGVRWDIINGVALKGEYCHVHPDNGSNGLFMPSPQSSVNVYSFAVNTVF